MPNYILNKNAQPYSGDHEVHDIASTKGCLPEPHNRISLDYHPSCYSAVLEAKRRYPSEAHKINGCFYCANACHTT